MRAVSLSLLVFLGFAFTAQAADRKIQDFYGVYLGHGAEEPGEGAPAKEDQPKTSRFSQVILKAAPEERGFTIEWATLKLKGDELPSEANTKSYVQTFRATERSNVYRDVTSGDPNLGADVSWAVINGDTLSIVQVTVAPDGNYFVAHYDRTLTEKGLDVRFTRFENSRVVRAVKLNLIKGPAKVN